MVVLSIVLSIAAVLFAGLGVLFVPIPVVGAVFAFGAPVLALAGVIVGGRAMSARKQRGQPSDAALVGVVLSALAFFPALLTALTCGVCNALCAGAPIEMQRDFKVHIGGFSADGGVLLPPGPGRVPGSLDGVPAHAADAGTAPPRALPPPPLPAGPGDP